jgi:hypothetical protein
MPQFVILRHETPPASLQPSHWDLLLEHGAALKTWSFTDWPTLDNTISAEQKPDHRRVYLTYEGELTGNRGSVARKAWGEFRWLRCDDFQAHIEMIVCQGAANHSDWWQITLQRCDDINWKLRVIPFGVR